MNSQLCNRVPLLRFSEFSGLWERKQLSDIGAIRTGPFGSLLHEKDYVDDGTPIITVEHLSEQGIQHVNLPLVSDKDKKRLSGYRLEVGDIVFSRVGSVDRNSIITQKERGWLFSGRLLRIRLCPKNTVPKFLSLNLQQEYTQYRIRAVAVGQTMPSLNTEILKRFSVHLPPQYEEQQKIADFLSSIDTRIEQLEQKKALFEQFKKGLMRKLFSHEIRFRDDNGEEYRGWEKRKIREICEVNPPNDKLPERFIYIDLESVNSGILVERHKICKTTAPSRAQRLLRKHDVLIQTVRPYQQNNLYFELDGDYVASTGYAQLRTSESSKFLYFSLHVTRTVNRILASCTGTSYPAISSNDLGNIFIYLPQLQEQQKIADILSSIDRKIELINEQVNKTKKFKKGLLQQMFV